MTNTVRLSRLNVSFEPWWLQLTVGLLLSLTAGCQPLSDANESTINQKGRFNKSPAVAPLRALYLTDYSARSHNYEAQKTHLLEGVSRHLSIEFDVVGKSLKDTLELLDVPNFTAGYDVVIYNFCLPDHMNLERINNAIAQTRDFGTPAVLVHCALQSFLWTSPSQPENRLELMSAKAEWSSKYGDVPFPAWWRLVGVDSVRKEQTSSFTSHAMTSDHPITASLPERLITRKEELFRSTQVLDTAAILYAAQSTKDGNEYPVAWTHQVGAGKVFATTLGDNETTTDLYHFHQLLANGIAHITGVLEDNGVPTPGYGGTTAHDNYQGTVTCQISNLIEASSVSDIQDAVRRARQQDLSLKVISVKRSNSNNGFVCPEHGGILLNLWRMNEVLNLDESNLTVTVQPGIRAFELSAYLHERGYAITTMPDYTGVSVAGGIATGAHHSSLNIASSMADLVTSISIVDGKGQLQTFEGAEAAKAAVHLGMLGVVVEVTVRIERQYKLQYGHEAGTDTYLEYELEGKVRQHDYARAMWFVGNGRYVLDFYNRVDTETSGDSEHNLWTSSGNIFKIVGDIPYRILNQAPLRAQCDSALLRSRLWSGPIDAKDSDRRSPVGWSHKMLGSYCQPGRCPWDTDSVKSRTMEAALPLDRLTEWMSDVKEIIRKNRACFPVLGIYLRFSKGSDRWMGFNYGQDMVAFEIHVPKVANEAYPERSSGVYDEILKMTLKKYNGRPHWGKNAAPAFVGVGPNQYSRWSEFVSLKQQLDPSGLFENRIWRNMTQETPINAYPGCVLARDCYCTQDSDCGNERACLMGPAAVNVCR